MSAVWLTIVLVAVASAAIKAAGPLLLGDRRLGPRATVVVASLGPALLTALVLVDTITAGRRLVVDARLAGVAAAGIALLLRAPMLLVCPWRSPPPRWCACSTVDRLCRNQRAEGEPTGGRDERDGGCQPGSAAEQRRPCVFCRGGERDELLDLARIESGHLALSPESVDVHEVLNDTIDLIGPLAAERDPHVHSPSPPECSWTVQADRQRLKQVLLNLTSNAVKYNRHGGSISLTCQAGEDGRIRIAVADTGPGIPADKLPRLFTQFDRSCGCQGVSTSMVTGTRLVMTS